MKKDEVIDLVFKIIVVSAMLMLVYNIVYWLGKL